MFEKHSFSMLNKEVIAYLENRPEIKNVVLFGIETHVCVQQTSLDLLERGYGVTLLADGVSSQRAHDRAIALERISKAGAVITTTESVLFELLRDAKNPHFKKMLPLFKAQRPNEYFPNL